MNPLAGAQRVLFLHAHPDDESLATGALIAELREAGVQVAVLTATRGEKGEVTDEALLAGGDLVARRERELARALAVLGVTTHGFLGQPPALAPGRQPRRYTDSGMVWIEPDLAGPGTDAGPDALTAAPVEEAAADAAAFAEWFGAEVMVSYASHGGYGHPDHVACHHIARQAAALAGVGFVEILSAVFDEETGTLEWAPRGIEGAEVFDLPHRIDAVREALARYTSQVRVDGDEIVHVGGQRHQIPTAVTLRVDTPAPRNRAGDLR